MLSEKDPSEYVERFKSEALIMLLTEEEETGYAKKLAYHRIQRFIELSFAPPGTLHPANQKTLKKEEIYFSKLGFSALEINDSNISRIVSDIVLLNSEEIVLNLLMQPISRILDMANNNNDIPIRLIELKFGLKIPKNGTERRLRLQEIRGELNRRSGIYDN